MRRITIALVIAAAALAGCGGDDDEQGQAASTAEPGSGGGGGGGQTLKLAAPADGSLKFDKKTLQAKTGKVTIQFSNPSSVPHAVKVEGNGIEEKSSQVITKGKTEVTVELSKAGTYEFYCPVGQHEQAGMKGELKVS